MAKPQQDVNKELRQLGREAKEQQQEFQELKFPPIEVTEAGTRQKIAKYFVFAYFILLFILIVFIPLYNIWAYNVAKDKALVIPLSDIIQTYSAVVGPSLGFVIAYYFKSKNEG